MKRSPDRGAPANAADAGASDPVDVLIVTALKDELDAVLETCAANTSGDPRSEEPSSEAPGEDTWRPKRDARGYKYSVRTFLHDSGLPFSVAAARTSDMGETATAIATMRLIYQLRPRYLAMCGICAGARGEVELGDVIVAERLYKFDGGALRATPQPGSEKKQYVVQISNDLRTYNLDPVLRQHAEDFGKEWRGRLPARPRTIARQERALLERLAKRNVAIPNRGERKKCFPDWPAVIDRLTRDGFIKEGLRLTAKGRRRIADERLRFPEGPPLLRSRVHIGAIATSARLQRDDRLFFGLRKLVRKTLGCEMEGAAIGAVGELEIIDAIMVKGVADFGDGEKNDRFRRYAASAAARFLIAFFRRHIRIEPELASRPSDMQALPPAALYEFAVPFSPPPPAPAFSPSREAVSEGRGPVAPETAPAECSWVLLLRILRLGGVTDITADELRQRLVSITGDTSLTVAPSEDEPLLFGVESKRTTFESFRNDLVAQRGRDPLLKAVQYVGDTRADPEDPNAGRFGCSPRARDRLLWANVRSAGKDWYEIQLFVQSLNPRNPLTGRAVFHLHPTFKAGQRLEVPIVKGKATLNIGAWGSFTVGAEVDGGATKLELDLGNIPGVDPGFIDR